MSHTQPEGGSMSDRPMQDQMGEAGGGSHNAAARPKGETFTLSIELGNEAMSTAADVADALARASAMVAETGSWEGSITDENGNTVGRYLLEGAVV